MTGAPPTSFVLKAYLTEAEARSDSNPLQVTTNGATIINTDQADNYNFFTHTKYYFRIESNDAVKEFYIDWDDGEDNDPEGKANYTSIKFDVPQFVGITGHIFTQDKLHYPKLRAKSVAGFWSKFYQPYGDNVFKGIDLLQGDTSLSVGRNDKYVIESDQTSAERIPIFGPTPKPPVCILKTDKKRVFAGIDNDYLMGIDGDYDSGTESGTNNSDVLQLICSDSTTQTAKTGIRIRVTYLQGTDSTTSTEADLRVTDMAFGSQITGVARVLKMELLNHLEQTADSDASALGVDDKAILVGAYHNGSAYDSQWNYQAIGEVSLGNPIIEWDDPRYTVTLDATESYSRTPTQGIGKYWIHEGKPNTYRGWDQNADVQSVSSTLVSDSFVDGGNNSQKTISGIKKTSYAFRPYREWRDNNFRWLGKQVLARAQIETSTNAVQTTDTRATYNRSYIEHWEHEGDATNYSDTKKNVAGFGWPSDMLSANILGIKTNADKDAWSDMSANNQKAAREDLASGLNGQILACIDGATASPGNIFLDNITTIDDADDDRNFIVMARDKKWSKEWWNVFHVGRGASNEVFAKQDFGRADVVKPGDTSANADSGRGHMNIRVELYYSGLETPGSAGFMWKPLKYIDYTKYPNNNDTTWYRTGSWEWQEPDDWTAVDPDAIPDKFWPTGVFHNQSNADSFAYDTNTTFVSATYESQKIVFTGLNFSSTNEYKSEVNYTGSTDITDGLSVVADSNPATVVGKYFEFIKEVDAGDITYYPWFQQAATKEKVSFRISSAGTTSGVWHNWTDYHATYSNIRYGRHFTLKKLDGTEYGFWLDFGDQQEAGSLGVVANPWNLGTTSDVYDGNPGVAMHSSEATPDTVVAVNVGSITSGSASSQTSLDIATAIAASINGISGLAAASVVTEPHSSGDNYYVDVLFDDAGPYTSFEGFYAAHDQSSIAVGTSLNNLYLTLATGSSTPTTANRTHDGKAAGVTPAGYHNLSGKTAIVVAYEDGQSESTIAAATRTAIDSATTGITVSGTGNECILTQLDTGPIGPIVDGVNPSTTSGLDLRTRCTTTTETEGIDATVGEDFFKDKWDESNLKYGLLAIVSTDCDAVAGGSNQGGKYKALNIDSTWPCSNAHSQLIEVVDPMCVSLNTYSVVQSIGFSHKGKHQIINDRLGRADIRKIGATGGSITFGGIDLSGTTDREKFGEFQRRSTPLYIDVTHNNGDKSRFFGVITSMSEDHPTGGVIPKFGLQMQVSHMIMFNSSGTILTDGYISLGGEMLDEPRYI
jgi:hypothetical protein